MKHGGLSVTPGQRFETGLIATMRMPDGRTRSQHFTGAGTDATSALAEFCDTQDARVVTISTPATIYRDLQGSRGYTKRSHTRTGHKGGSLFFVPPPENAVAFPERDVLSKIGRMDLLA